MSVEMKELLEELQNLHNDFRRNILHKLSNTTPSKISNDQFNAVITSAKHLENDWSKLIKNFKKAMK